MIDVARERWPADMQHAAGGAEAGSIESVAQGVVDSVRRYVREQPEAAALWALGIGFVLGWKLKIW